MANRQKHILVSQVDVPRDRNGEFVPKPILKYQRGHLWYLRKGHLPVCPGDEYTGYS